MADPLVSRQEWRGNYRWTLSEKMSATVMQPNGAAARREERGEQRRAEADASRRKSRAGDTPPLYLPPLRTHEGGLPNAEPILRRPL